MRKSVISLWLLGLCLTLAPVVTAAESTEPLNVAVSILPQQYFVQAIGQEHVNVTVMVEPGGDPHVYEPRPQQMAALAEADVYFSIGVNFEDVWLERFQEANPDMLLVHSDENIHKLPMAAHHHDHGEAGEHGEHHGEEAGHHEGEHHEHGEQHEEAAHHEEGEHHEHGEQHEEAEHHEHGEHHDEAGHHEEAEHHEHGEHHDEAAHHEHGHDHGTLDPHIWLAPSPALAMAEAILAGLMEADPDNAAAYQANFDALAQEIANVDQDVRAQLDPIPEDKRHFMVFHPAWGYFAHEYHLRQVPVEVGGSEPSARELAEVVEHAQENQVRVIFVQPQMSEQTARTIAEEIGAHVVVLDPLAEDWPANMRSAAEAMAQAMQ
ncbi:MAG: ABC transporter substrate-binding protein [Desulfovibrio sp.]|nr:MAG: ABC transporter substrate-binding protein [Desulfovibrio sp.]